MRPAMSYHPKSHLFVWRPGADAVWARLNRGTVERDRHLAEEKGAGYNRRMV